MNEIDDLYGSAAYYGAPLSVAPERRYGFSALVLQILECGDARLKNLLPVLLLKNGKSRPDSLPPEVWEFTLLAKKQVAAEEWTEEDRRRWRSSCSAVEQLGVHPRRALENIRRFRPPE